MTLQRKNRALGYFSPKRFGALTEKGLTTDEIAMNPAHFATRTPTEVLSTLAHEMAHLWQEHFGKPSRACYHNKEWAEKMKAIGLHPSATGLPGGKETGQHMTHYILAGGPFAVACEALLSSGYKLVWYDRGGDQKKPTKSGQRVKYVCPECDAAAWGKPELSLICGECHEAMEGDE